MILAGDISQLQAVENGGGMSLLADRLGYVRLAEPVRFRHHWEHAASLRLRDGDIAVLAEYDQHGRIIGGEPEQMMDTAARAYVALTTAGTDTLLMAADHARRRELNRRIRDDLIHLGLVQDGPAVTIADGTQASPGDLIVCTRNDHRVEAGEPGRTLANGDLLRIDAVTRNGPAGPPRPGRRPAHRAAALDGTSFLYASYQDSELGYAVTDHVAQGRTVHAGLTLITGTEDRQHAYVALTRGTHANHAYVFTVSPKRADPAPGPRPAPELARYDRIQAERPGIPPRPPSLPRRARRSACCPPSSTRRPGTLRHPDPRPGPVRRRPPGHPARDLDRRDHPGPRPALPRPAHDRAAARLPRRTRPPGPVAVADPARRRTRRPGPRRRPPRRDRERDLSDARDIAAVIDARIRHRLGSVVPRRPGPGPRRSPPSPTPTGAPTSPRSPR